MSEPINPYAHLGNLAYFFGGHAGALPSFAEGEGMEDKRKMSEALRALSDQVLPLLQRSNSGGATSTTIIAALEELATGDADKESLQHAIGICAEYDGDFACPKKTSEMLGTEAVPFVPADEKPVKSKPGLVAFQVFPIELAFSSRDTDTLDVFFNAIPNLEWSRCVPYFDVLVISSGKPLGGDGTPLTMSQHLFLSPNSAIETDLGKSMANALPGEIIGEALGNDQVAEVGAVTAAGMELFTSPQTLVNANEEYFDPPGGTEDDRSGHAILDKFRPFMTLKNFSVNVQPSYGMNAYKTAKMTLTLHDRSRLAQIAPLVKPDLYGGTELRVEYGWSHPDAVNAPGNNPIGDFIHSLRCKEKYRIINSSFTFTEDGQVNVDVKLAMKGSTELYTEVTTNGEGSASLMPALQKLTAELATLTKELDGAGSVIEDVSGRTALTAGSSSSAALRVNQDTLNEIAKFIEDNKKDAAGAGLNAVANKLQEIFGTDGSDGMIQEIENNAATALSRKKAVLSNGVDAFAAQFPFKAIGEDGPGIPQPSESGKMGADYVSLGKLLMTYVGKPLQMSGQFDEVQFVFYSFNRLAGFVRHHNIAQFPIQISEFNKTYEAKFKPTLSTSLNAFINFVNSEFIMNESVSKVYGLDAMYEPDEDGNLVIKEALQKEPSALTSEREELLKNAYPDGHPVEFRKPQLQVAFECVPVAEVDPGNTENTITDETRTILRVFVYDKSASAFDPQNALLSSMSQNNFGIVSANDSTGTPGTTYGNQEYTAQHGERMAKVMDGLEAAGIISLQASITVNGAAGATKIEDVVTVNATGSKLKEYLRKTAPSCIIGSTGNPIMAASLASMNDPALASIRMSAATTSGKGGVQGNADEGFPTFIQPTSLSVDMFGMPLLSYASNVFFDFNTNTSVDNFYVCTGIDHTFAPGEFKTSAKFTQVDGFEKFRSAATDVKRQLAMAALSLDQLDATATSEDPDAVLTAVTVNLA